LSTSVAELTGSVAEFECCFLSVGSTKIDGRMVQFGGRFCAGKIKQKLIFGARFVPVFLGFFYYKYRLCIRANLEIEGAETRV